MAQSKLNDLAGKFGKGGPPGLGIGLKLLAAGAVAVYGISQSMYTGDLLINQSKAVESSRVTSFVGRNLVKNFRKCSSFSMVKSEVMSH